MKISPADAIRIKWCLRNTNHRFEDFSRIRELSRMSELYATQIEELHKIYEKNRRLKSGYR